MIFDLLIDKEIGEDWWGEEPGEFFISAKYVRQELAKAEEAEGVRLVIDSPGGSVFEGITIFNIIRDFARNHPEKTFESYIQGMAASMASVIALAPAAVDQKHKVVVEDNSVFMIHNAWAVAVGNKNDLRAHADWMENLDKVIRSVYVAKTGKEEKTIEKMMDDETWLWGKEILEAGFATSLLQSENVDFAAEDRAVRMAYSKDSFRKSQDKVQKMAAKAPQRNWSAAAACLKMDKTVGVPADKTPVEGASPEKNYGGSKKMTVDELKKDNPELYAALVAEGEKAGAEKEKARASRLMAMGEKAGAMDYAMECIKNGVSPNDEAVIDAFMDKKVASAALKAEREEGNVPGLPVRKDANDKKAMEDAFDSALKSGGDDNGDN